MSRQHWILLILVLYLVASLCVGIWSSRISQKAAKPGGFLKNYFIGGRSMGGLVLAMTLVATYTSASSFLGGPGLAASWGLTQSWVAVIQIGTTFLTLGILGKKLGIISRRIGAVTISDYLRKRYESPFVVILCSVLLVVFFVTQMVAQFIGGATLIQSVTGLSYEAGLALFAGIVILYTVIGGFRAVVMTDTLQGFIMTIGTFLLLFFVIRAGGGMENITNYLDANNPGWNLLCKGDYSGEVAALAPGYLISFWVLVVSYIWKNLGYNVVLWLAGLAGISPSIYEAAAVDGAGAWTIFWRITLPNLLPSLFTITVLSFLNAFKVFREAYLVAGDYPHDSMYLLQHLFNNWFRELSMDKLAAGAVMTAGVILFLILLLRRAWETE